MATSDEERAREITEKYGYVLQSCRGPCQQDITDALAAARRETVEKCCKEIRSRCQSCDNGVFPFEQDGVVIPLECEYCGKPIDAIRAAFPPDAKPEDNGDARQRFDAAAVELANEFFEGIETMDEEGEDIGPDGLRVQSIAANVLNAARELGIVTEQRP